MSKQVMSRNDLVDGGRRVWTRAEQDMLVELALAGHVAEEIARRLGRTRTAVGYMANRMGGRMAHPGGWTPEEEAHLGRLIARHGVRNVRVIARELGRSADQVNLKLLHHRAAPARLRNCMACQTLFRSEGAHHRLCADCRRGDGLPDGW
ncbi:MAG: SANT/Myb-like DNA-binding domain-containing protein [Alphaproteobacteria bacterium]